MNKRVDELFGQALDAAVPETWSKLDMTQLHRLKEKFAQLIVRECVSMLDHNGNYLIDDAATKQIEKYFGVDE